MDFRRLRLDPRGRLAISDLSPVMAGHDSPGGKNFTDWPHSAALDGGMGTTRRERARGAGAPRAANRHCGRSRPSGASLALRLHIRDRHGIEQHLRVGMERCVTHELSRTLPGAR